MYTNAMKVSTITDKMAGKDNFHKITPHFSGSLFRKDRGNNSITR